PPDFCASTGCTPPMIAIRGTAIRSVFDPPVIGRYPPVSCLRENKPPGRVAGGDLSLSFVSETVDAARPLISEKHAHPASLLRSMIKFGTMSGHISTTTIHYFVRTSEDSVRRHVEDEGSRRLAPSTI